MAGGRRYVVSIAGRSLQVEVVETPDGAAVLVDGRRYPAELSPGQGAGPRRLSVGGSRHDLLLMVRDDVISLAIDGVALDATIQDERAARLASFGGGRTRQAGRASVTAPMPGLVVRIPVEAGQSVEAGQVVVVLQAMKMENELGSPRAGTIARVNVAAGQPVEQGQVLVELE